MARIIHNFGRADSVDKEALRRLVASISRLLEPGAAPAGASSAGIELVEARRYGGAWVLDRLFERLRIGAALRSAAADRRLDGEAVERILFALVAQRALEPASKLVATRWTSERVAINRCPAFSEDAAYRAMDFLLEALPEITVAVFARTASLLNLACDVIFVDTSSTYFESEVADEELGAAMAAKVRPGASRCAVGASPATPPTRRSSAPSTTTSPAGS